MAELEGEGEQAVGEGVEVAEESNGTFAVRRNKEYGRYVVAARNIPRKGLLLNEVPVMCAPWPIDDKVTFEEPLCLGCCMHMTCIKRENAEGEVQEPRMSALNRCSKCNWPVCSKLCEQVLLHKDNECQVFQETRLPYPPPGDNMNIVTTSVMIQLIRCLLIKRHNLPLWTKSVLSLQSETALGTLPWNFHLLLDDVQQIFPELETTMGSREECCRVLSVININAFSNTFSENGEFSGCAICLFLQASMIAHSCTPNCWWTLTEDPSHRIIIKTSEDIKTDDLVTVCYSNQYSVLGTWRRQEMFRSIGGFTCKCKRCVDPTELSSLASAVLCENCMIGHKLPLQPTDANSKWKCDRCSHLESAETVESVVKALESRHSSCIGNVALLVRFLENCKTLLHNNHWIVLLTEDSIMKEWANDPDLRYRGTCIQDILITCEYFISICFHALSVRSVTSPGLSSHRVRYLLFFARTRMARLEFLVNLLEDQVDAKARGRMPREVQNLREEYQEILELYNEVVEYRHMSGSSDAEVKCEIEHLIKVIQPIMQIEPQRRGTTCNHNDASATPSAGANELPPTEMGCTLS